MEPASLSDGYCQFCRTCVSCDSIFPVELSDRLNDLNALQALTNELKSETVELVERNSVVMIAEMAERMRAGGIQAEIRVRVREEDTAKHIDSCCLQLAEQSVELRKEKENLLLLQQKRKALQESLHLKQLVKCSLVQNMAGATEYVRCLRYREACALFDMIAIQVNLPPKSNKARTGQSDPLRGYSTIMGLPLLNSGDYDGMPVEIVSSALSFAAHLVDTVAAVLNIHLDHPLRPFETFECVTSPNSDQSLLLPLTPALSQNLSAQQLLEPFAADYRNKLLDEKDTNPTHHTQKKYDKTEVLKNNLNKKAISHGDKTGLKKREEREIGVNDEWIPNPSFSLALSLFRANVITLCLRCGIEGASLWPHEAILLNLSVLRSKCTLEARGSDHISQRYQSKFGSTSSPFPLVYSDPIDDNGDDNGGEGAGCSQLPGLIRRYRSKRIVKMETLERL